MKEASAIVLAGGRNTRIARNKAFIQLPAGETILQNTLDVLGEIFPEIIIVTNKKQAYLRFGVQVVEDLIKGAVLWVESSPDYAFLHPDLILWWLAICRLSNRL